MRTKERHDRQKLSRSTKVIVGYGVGRPIGTAILVKDVMCWFLGITRLRAGFQVMTERSEDEPK